MSRLSPASSMILVVDIQDKLAQAMSAERVAQVMRAAAILLESASALGVRVIATEQYPKGLGPTVSPIRERLLELGAPVLEKLEFSAVEAPGFGAIWQERPPKSVVVIGMETHVCVFQTVRELRARGLNVQVPCDGVASRREDHRETGLQLCRELGAQITTAETVAFDWLGRASGEAFKRISKAVR